MILVVIAAYILFITLILMYSPRILWLLFLLFCYRFWELILPYDKMMQYISLTHSWHHTLILGILAVLTYFGVLYAASGIPILKYVVLLIIGFFVIRKYDLVDIFFLRDILQEHGMWNIDFWVHQIKELFASSADEKQTIFGKVWNDMKESVQVVWGYVKSL